MTQVNHSSRPAVSVNQAKHLKCQWGEKKLKGNLLGRRHSWNVVVLQPSQWRTEDPLPFQLVKDCYLRALFPFRRDELLLSGEKNPYLWLYTSSKKSFFLENTYFFSEVRSGSLQPNPWSWLHCSWRMKTL